jgi:hypothetical protein
LSESWNETMYREMDMRFWLEQPRRKWVDWPDGHGAPIQPPSITMYHDQNPRFPPWQKPVILRGLSSFVGESLKRNRFEAERFGESSAAGSTPATASPLRGHGERRGRVPRARRWDVRKQTSTMCAEQLTLATPPPTFSAWTSGAPPSWSPLSRGSDCAARG